MTWYIEIPRINGRKGYVELAERLYKNGFMDRVEYCEGGWADKNVTNLLPHLKFEFEDDAIAYMLAFGGTITTSIPLEIITYKPEFSI